MSGAGAAIVSPGEGDVRQNGCLHRFSASPEQTRVVLAEVVQGLDSCGASPETRGNVEIVLAEAINNVVEHAYAGDGGLVELRVCKRDAWLECEIVDWGVCMPGMVVPRSRMPRLDRGFEHVPEGGFGWSLIRSLAVDLAYGRHDGHNLLQFRIPLT